MLIYVFDAFLMRERLLKLAEPFGYKVVGSDSFEEAVTQIASLSPQIVFAGAEAWTPSVAEEIQILRKVGGRAPLVLLSQDARRSTLTAAAVAGASDYIVLPVDDATLSQRIQRLSPGPKGSEADKNTGMEAAVDFQRELDIYFRDGAPAPEGLGLLMAVLFRPGARIDHALELEYHHTGSIFFQGIRSQVVRRQADKFFRYGNQTYLAVLPSATEKGCQIIAEKMDALLLEQQKQEQLPSTYRLAIATVFVPQDGHDRETLVANLAQRVRYAIARMIPGVAK